MTKIAIDIVLLPNQEMISRAVEISKRQSAEYNNEKIVLDEKVCLPHISLAMGVIEEDNIPKANIVIKEIASSFQALELKADHYQGNRIPSGDIVSEFTVANTPKLQSLHEVTMRKLKALLTHDASLEMVFSPPSAEEITLYWIRNYAKKSSFENFKPHITLGFGELKDIQTSINFTASTIAICHLGNYCTCQKILFSAKLKQS